MVNHLCLGKYGYTIDRSKIDKKLEKEIMKELTISTVILPAYRDFQKPETYKIYYFNNDALYLPRFYGIQKFGPPKLLAVHPCKPMTRT